MDNLDNLNKEDFIKFAKQFNVLKTLKEPNYLLMKQQILNLLPKYELTENDIVPDVRVSNHSVCTTSSIHK